ncbi:MAG: hypothetical protein HW386_2360 [Gammaproteobacteria bacterium]|nr:hypothetical protein [Gammaproteobacteria bacterium]
MALHFDLIGIVLVIMIMTAGTALQSTVGFGLGLVAGPLLVLIDRDYLPGPMLLAALLLTCFMAFRERHAIDFSGLKYSVMGRMLSTPPAALIVGFVTATTFDVVFSCMILAAVGMSLIHGKIQPSARNIFLAAIASGFMSTIGAIGGPPLALVYQNTRGPELRANLSALFAVGCLISLIALALVGKFVLTDLVRGGILITGVLIGLIVSRPLVQILDQYTIRPYVLGVCTIAALVVLGRALLQLA